MVTQDMRDNELRVFLRNTRLSRGVFLGLIIITALLAFEVFNYGTTDYALTDLLGNLEFMRLRWATILTIAFCGVDFAGIARLFSPDGDSKSQNETWYLFGAWILAATMNAMLTWWGVSLAILNHQTLTNSIIERQTLLRVAPIFVAVLVWLIRVLIIGTLSVAGDHLFFMINENSKSAHRNSDQIVTNPSTIQNAAHLTSLIPNLRSPLPRAASASPRPKEAHNMREVTSEPEYSQAELIYHPISVRSNRGTPNSTSRKSF